MDLFENRVHVLISLDFTLTICKMGIKKNIVVMIKGNDPK